MINMKIKASYVFTREERAALMRAMGILGYMSEEFNNHVITSADTGEVIEIKQTFENLRCIINFEDEPIDITEYTE